MLVAARDAGVQRFVYAASSSTYGDHEALPKVEETIGKPLSPYAITKYVNELYADNFFSTYGLNTIGLRYFNVFGRRQDPNGAYAAVIPLFVKQFMKHESPLINGDGTFSRDFTYIDNIIEAVVRTADRTATANPNWSAGNPDPGTSNAPYRLFNIGNESTVELLRYIEVLEQCLGRKAKMELLPLQAGDVPDTEADVSELINAVDYRPQVSVETGVANFVAWYRDYYKI